MKRLQLFIVLLSGLVILFQACQKSEIMTYDDQNQPPNIYFSNSVTNNPYDTILVKLADSTSYQPVVSFSVSAMGLACDSARPFKVIVLPTSTARLDSEYLALPDVFYMKAGAVTAKVPITFHRSGLVKKQELYLDIALVPNEYFSTNMKEKVTKYTDKTKSQIVNNTVSCIKLRIGLYDGIVAPTIWTAASSKAIVEGYLGIYSSKKLLLICSLMGILPKDFASDLSSIQFYGVYTQRYLNDMKEAGTPVYEDDGVTLMTMGPSVQ